MITETTTVGVCLMCLHDMIYESHLEMNLFDLRPVPNKPKQEI